MISNQEFSKTPRPASLPVCFLGGAIMFEVQVGDVSTADAETKKVDMHARYVMRRTATG